MAYSISQLSYASRSNTFLEFLARFCVHIVYMCVYVSCKCVRTYDDRHVAVVWRQQAGEGVAERGGVLQVV